MSLKTGCMFSALRATAGSGPWEWPCHQKTLSISILDNMGTLYIDRKGYHIKLQGQAMAFYLNGKKEGTAPIGPLQKVVVIGNCTIDTAVLRRLIRNGAVVVFLSGRTQKFSGILTGRLNYNGLLRVAQYRTYLDKEFCLKYAKEVISEKLQKQKALLQGLKNTRAGINIFLNTAIEQIESLLDKTARADNIDSLRGLEGVASRTYFDALSKALPPSLGFKGRTKRPPKDPVNALFSFTYTLLYYEIVTELLSAGLDPTVGYYHQFDYGRDSLACDIEEVFRVDVDCFVIRLFKEKTFNTDDFFKEQDGVFLKKSARARFYPVYESWAKDTRAQIRQHIKQLVRKLDNGQDSLSG